MRTSILLAAFCLSEFLAAQEPDGPSPGGGKAVWLHESPVSEADSKLTVQVHTNLHGLLDDGAYLADLQKRFAEKGVRVVAFVPAADAEACKRLAGIGVAHLTGEATPAAAPGVTVIDLAMFGGAPSMVQTPMVMVAGRDGTPLFAGPTGGGLVDAIEKGLAGEPWLPAELLPLRVQVEHNFENSGDQRAALGKHVELSPRDGIAWGLLYLSDLWFGGDPAAAHERGKLALQALGVEAMPLAAFADLALRGDPYDKALAVEVAMALTPAAAGNPDSAPVQLAFLRALLRAGRDREAGRTAQKLAKLLAGRWRELLVFAETLADAAQPAPYRDLAEKALENAAAVLAAAGKEQPIPPQEQRWLFGARHDVALRCAGDAEAAAKVAAEYRASEAFTNTYSDLNNDCWYLSTYLDTMGRFDGLALAQIEELWKSEGEAISFGNRDTLALAYFLAGRAADAVRHQKKATEQSGGRGEYLARLKRFEATQKRLAATK